MRVVVFLALVAAVAAGVAEKNDADRAKFVDFLNSQPGMTWTAAINDRFRGQPIGAARSLCGVKRESKQLMLDAIAAGFATHAKDVDMATLPTEFDSAANWPECADVIGDIRDQSACGCCWAFGAAESASDRLCINSKGQMKFPLSAQETCFCAQMDGCDGGQLYTAWSYIQSYGLVTGGQYNNTGPFKNMCSDFSLPHCHHHGPRRPGETYPDEGTTGCPTVTSSPSCPSSCDASAASPHNNFATDKYTFKGQVSMYSSEGAIAQAIMEAGPVETAFTVYSDFENYSSGIYQHTSGQVLGGHAVKIVGWGEEGGVKYWKVANSWNPYWGENGYFRIVRGQDECGIEDQVTASDSSSVWGKMSP